MDNIQPPIPLQPLPPKPAIWETNPKLKTLLLILIFVFLFSGLGLVVFAQWSNSYREKVYEETKAGLPKHVTGASENQKIGESDMAGWKIYKNEQYGFEFQYPGDWQLHQSDPAWTVARLTKSNIEGLTIFVEYDNFNVATGIDKSINSTNRKILNLLQVNANSQVASYFSIDESNAFVPPISSYLVSVELPSAKGKAINIILQQQNKDKSQNGPISDEFNKILSTFKFTK